MSKRELQLGGIGFCLFIVFSIEFVVQSVYINYIVMQSQEKIIRCYEKPKNGAVDVCLVEYIDDRNIQAKKSVNSYLISIALFASIGTLHFYIRKKQRRKKQC